MVGVDSHHSFLPFAKTGRGLKSQNQLRVPCCVDHQLASTPQQKNDIQKLSENEFNLSENEFNLKKLRTQKSHLHPRLLSDKKKHPSYSVSCPSVRFPSVLILHSGSSQGCQIESQLSRSPLHEQGHTRRQTTVRTSPTHEDTVRLLIAVK